MNFADLKAQIAASSSGLPFEHAVQALQEKIFGLSAEATLLLIQDIGAIPESIDHDSSEEKLYAKATDILLAKALQDLGLRSTVTRERANCADVHARSIHEYSLVADAKAFRLSRTAKNQKDFKVTSLSGWRNDSDYAVLVAPYYQYPRTASQIYGQALDDNVCLFSWEHLALLLRSGIRESEGVTLAPVWSLSAALAERVTVSNKTRNASFHELGNDLICAHLRIERTRLDAELGRYRQATIQRGFEEISFWEARIAEISEFSRERAITELVLALKVNEKISSIRKFIRSIGAEMSLRTIRNLSENSVACGESIELLGTLAAESVHLILSDIPYGIGADDWDVLHDNTNSAFLGSSPAQERAGAVFRKRGKPLNGWSEADREIPRQYYEWCAAFAAEWLRVLKPGGSAIVFAGRRLAHRCVAAFEDAGFTYKDTIAWLREKAPHRAQRLSVVYERRGDACAATRWTGWRVGNLRPTFEPIHWFVKPYRIGGTIADNVLEHAVGAFNEAAYVQYMKQPDNVISVRSGPDDSGLHPTQKPLALMKALIELTTLPGQVVLDPYCGSGTTLVAAADLGRRYLGVDIDESYCSTARSRLNRLSSQIRLFDRSAE